jgi:hypothetical protein
MIEANVPLSPELWAPVTAELTVFRIDRVRHVRRDLDKLREGGDGLEGKRGTVHRRERT